MHKPPKHVTCIQNLACHTLFIILESYLFSKLCWHNPQEPNLHSPTSMFLSHLPLEPQIIEQVSHQVVHVYSPPSSDEQQDSHLPHSLVSVSRCLFLGHSRGTTSWTCSLHLSSVWHTPCCLWTTWERPEVRTIERKWLFEGLPNLPASTPFHQSLCGAQLQNAPQGHSYKKNPGIL